MYDLYYTNVAIIWDSSSDFTVTWTMICLKDKFFCDLVKVPMCLQINVLAFTYICFVVKGAICRLFQNILTNNLYTTKDTM